MLALLPAEFTFVVSTRSQAIDMAEATLLDTHEAAIIWRDRSLLGDQGIFSDQDIWTMVNLRALWVALTGDKVDARRLESLGKQLQETGPDVVKLAAELYWVMYLASGSNCISHTRKTDIVRTIYDWSGDSLPPNHPLLKEISLSISGGPGLFFSARRGDELFFLIKSVVGFKKHGSAERRQLLTDAGAVGRMLDEAAGDAAPQLNHILRHLLFPETYEPVFTRRDKRRIVESFSGIPRREATRWNSTRLDEELSAIRRQLQPLYDDQAVSFLQEPLLQSWRQGSAGEHFTSCEQRFWVEKSPHSTRPDRTSGPDAVGMAIWTPRQTEDDSAALMREVEPGDLVFHFTDNQGFSGVSVVSEELEEDFDCPVGSPWDGQPGLRIALAEFTEITPLLSREALLGGPKFQAQLKQLASRFPSLFFNKQLTLNRDHYLTEAPEGLVHILNECYLHDSNRHLPHVLLPDKEDLDTSTSDEPNRYPVAQLLTGPSATGKTFTAMARAVEICDGHAPANHDHLVSRYQELEAAGRVDLVTFHPSFSYADFMERPGVRITESGHTSTCEPGILRRMAERAGIEPDLAADEQRIDDNAVWKFTPEPSSTEVVGTDQFLEGGFISCSAGGDTDFSGCSDRAGISKLLSEKSGATAEESISVVDQLVNQMNVDDVVILTSGELDFLAIGRVTGDYQHRGTFATTDGDVTCFQTRAVSWFNIQAQPGAWQQIARKKFLPRSLYRLDASLLHVGEIERLLQAVEPEQRNHVLIIDEIGRGDVASIFGELTTLLAADNRRGGQTPLTVTLPLSGEPFSLPDNVYLIATHNSAEPMDAASRNLLGRRFEFDDLQPDPSLIRGDDQLGMIADEEGGRIDLRLLMMTINRRIEHFSDCTGCLGQGYFMHIRCYQDLTITMRARIIPHLKVLFDDDWRKVQLVLADINPTGEANEPQIISHENLETTGIPGFEDAVQSRTRYWLTADRELTPDAFRKVYSASPSAR